MSSWLTGGSIVRCSIRPLILTLDTVVISPPMANAVAAGVDRESRARSKPTLISASSTVAVTTRGFPSALFNTEASEICSTGTAWFAAIRRGLVASLRRDITQKYGLSNICSRVQDQRNRGIED